MKRKEVKIIANSEEQIEKSLLAEIKKRYYNVGFDRGKNRAVLKCRKIFEKNVKVLALLPKAVDVSVEKLKRKEAKLQQEIAKLQKSVKAHGG